MTPRTIMNRETKKAPATGPFAYQPVVKPEAKAIKALAMGQADEYQQKLALACIRQKLCAEAESSFISGDPHASAFVEGRRYVGVTLRQILEADMAAFPEVDHG